MRVLTVRPPRALHIMQSGKDVENRVRSLGPYIGPVAIHAGLQADEEAMRALPGLPPNGVPRIFHYGAILGTVELTGAHRANDCYQQSIQEAARLFGSDRAAFDALPVPSPRLGGLLSRARLCSTWAHHDCHHLTLADPTPFGEPIRATGRLGLWRPDPELAEAIAYADEMARVGK